MANELVISIKDKSKAAICKETLALCGKYDVVVEDMTGDGYIVLHDRVVLPNVWPYDPDCKWSAPMASEASWFGYAALTEGETTENAPLDLSMEKLVNKLAKQNPLNSVVPVEFSVYENGVGLIGTGTMQILVTEAYATSSQSFVSFKGDKGDTGDKGDDGEGVPNGGSTGQVLTKKSAVDYDCEWRSTSDFSDENAVHYVEDTGKSTTQKAIARNNIGAIRAYRSANGTLVLTSD